MLDNLSNWFGALASSRSRSLSVPVFDGAFKPNNLLEEANPFSQAPGMKDLAIDRSGQLYVARQNGVYTVDDTGAQAEMITFDDPVSALAFSDDNKMCVALGDKVVIAAGSDEERVVERVAGKRFKAVTALAPSSQGECLVCDGSNEFVCDDWAADLMSKNRGGRLVRLGSGDDTDREVVSGLAYAFGAHESSEGGTLVSESWAHSVISAGGKQPARVLDRLPGYPCRFAGANDGGFWLSMFCSRTQLVEFVLKSLFQNSRNKLSADPNPDSR